MLTLGDGVPGKRFVMVSALGAVLLFFTVTGLAHAGNAYVGLGIGNAHSTFNRDSVPFDQPDLASDETGYRLFGGYRLSEYFSLEGAYDYLGKARASENVFGDFFVTKVTGFEVSAVGSLPIGADFSVFVKGGMIFWHSDVTYQSTGVGSGSNSETGSDLAAGLGVKYDFDRGFGARLDYSFYDIDKAEAGSGAFQVILISGMFAF